MKGPHRRLASVFEKDFERQPIYIPILILSPNFALEMSQSGGDCFFFNIFYLIIDRTFVLNMIKSPFKSVS